MSCRAKTNNFKVKAINFGYDNIIFTMCIHMIKVRNLTGSSHKLSSNNISSSNRSFKFINISHALSYG